MESLKLQAPFRFPRLRRLGARRLLTDVRARTVRASADKRLPALGEIWLAMRAHLINVQTPMRAVPVGEMHYDVGDDPYACMLDSRMMYSCAYQREACYTESASVTKIDLVCRKLGLEPGMRVLHMGRGGAAAYVAEQCGAKS